MLTDDQWTDVLTSLDPAGYSSPNAYVDELKSAAQEEYGKDLSPEQVEHGKWQWAEVVRIDYQEWSGGWLPGDETDPQISTYCELAASNLWDRDAVKLALLSACRP